MKTALVLGATGGIGSEVADRLVTAGWAVRALHRSAATQKPRHGVSWFAGDAMTAADVLAAARGASLIVHAVNPPAYRHWDRLVLPMIDNTIAAARENGARVLLPGTIYNYGPDAFPEIAEDAPQNPVTRKGAVRVEMERRLEALARSGDASVLIVRAGDFFGPRAANSWFSQGIVKAGSRPSSLYYPGDRGVGHAWAYLPDLAATMVSLVGRPDLEAFARYHMDGHWDADGTAMMSAIRDVLGEPAVSMKQLPWTMMRLASPFVPLFRELIEMRYIWQTPVRLSNQRLLAVLGHEPRTSLHVAVRETLVAMNCIVDPASPVPR